MSPASPSRRQFLARASLTAGALTLPSLLSACGSGGDSASGAAASPSGVNAKWPRLRARQVVLAGFGGETYRVRQQEQFAPFTKLAGARVVEAPWDYGKFVSMVAAPSPEWDMIDFDGFSVAALVQQGKAPGKLADWVRRCDLVDAAYRDYAGGSYAYSVVMGWSTKLGATPRGWADFFDLKRFPGKRAFPKSIYAGTMELALLADGVPKDKIYPLDFDRALAKLDTIKSSLIFYDSYAQGQQYMAQGSASMIATANSRVIQLKNSGRGVDWTYQDAILYPWGAFGLTRHAPNADAANALIDFMSTPESQAAVARKLYLGPTVSKAFESLTPTERALQPSAPENVAKQLSVNVDALAKQDNDYVKKFFAWVGE
ncbi:extracellular solute-binding protein [Spirillospora sp. NPDC047279]|uniref:extracellular solute-binding protein n=1 Tax=Spirillospora sp. NPDC047279 TaxID=3155478 RepID=UPI0033D71FC5